MTTVADAAYDSIVFAYQSYCLRLLETAPTEEMQFVLDNALALPDAGETAISWESVAAVAEMVLQANAVAGWTNHPARKGRPPADILRRSTPCSDCFGSV